MRVGHVFVGLIFLWVLPVSECPVNNVSLTSRHLTSCCNLGAYFPSRNIILGGRNKSFLDRLSVPLEFLDSLYCDHNNSYGVGSNEPLCLWNLDAEIKIFSHILSCGYAKTRFALLSSIKVKFRRHKCPCSYYSNSMAVFHLPLVGDLVFKLSPGPVANSTPRIASTLRNNDIHRNKSLLSPCNSLTMGLLNIRSLRNKTADFVDYVCETKEDLFAITETWLCPSDDAIRNELCPVGYVSADHSRTSRRGGGTALVYRNSLTVKEIDAGKKTSFEFSEWTVQSSSHNLRIIVIYRPPLLR